MDQISLVNRRIDDGLKLLQRLAQDGFAVMIAFWLKPSDDVFWHLYIASKIVDERGPTEAYRALQKSLRQLVGTTISLTDVKLVGTENQTAKHMLRLRSRQREK